MNRTADVRPNRWIVGISGASGTVYARTLLKVLATHLPELEIHVVISEGAQRVLIEEEGLTFSSRTGSVVELLGAEYPNITLHNNRDTGAAIASGSFPVDGMIVIPCSMTTLSGIAHGFADNLLRRAADVAIKEGRRLIIVPRETPLSQIHLTNLLTLSKMGVTILPAMPGFYTRPESIEQLVLAFVMRVTDQMGLSLEVAPRWGENLGLEM